MIIILNQKRNKDSWIDYDIICDGTVVGELQTIEDERDYIFGRQISVTKEYQGHGIATSIINDFILSHDKPFRFCIATNSEKAVDFWQFYLDATSFQKQNIRGDIWELRKEE